jgi:hypothetical protein
MRIRGTQFRVEMEFLNGILRQVSEHKFESTQTRVFVWFSTIFFLFHKMLLMNRLDQVFLFRGFFCKDF